MSPTTRRSKLENDVTAAVALAVLGAGVAHLVDHVIPPVPVRQWVISVPERRRSRWRLRGFRRRARNARLLQSSPTAPFA